LERCPFVYHGMCSIGEIHSGMLVYSFHIYRWPARLLHMLDKLIKNFDWSGDTDTRKICKVY
jgi:hypothetical protein